MNLENLFPNEYRKPLIHTGLRIVTASCAIAGMYGVDSVSPNEIATKYIYFPFFFAGAVEALAGFGVYSYHSIKNILALSNKSIGIEAERAREIRRDLRQVLKSE